MNRLALLTATAFLTLTLAACGERAEKKADTNAAAQPQTTQPATDSTTTTTTPSDATKTGQ